MLICTSERFMFASAICEATARFQISSYNFCSEESPVTLRILTSVGRIASWASWALAFLVLYWRER